MPEGEIFIEKRRYRRVEKKLKVIYKVMPSSGVNGDGTLQAKKNVESADISINGIQLICDEDFEADKILRLDVIIEDENEPLATFAEVRWSAHDDKINKYRVGMEFLVIKEDHINIIKRITGE